MGCVGLRRRERRLCLAGARREQVGRMEETGAGARSAGAKRRGARPGFDPRRLFGMLLMSARLGSARARAIVTLVLFLAIWLLLSIPDAFAASLTRQSSFTYDSASGLLLTEKIEPNDSAFTVTTTYAYDAFGNTLSATVTGTGIASRTSSTTYEANGRFALTATNALGHSESVVTEPKFGNPTSQTGPNGLTTTWTYDSFGRPTLETRPDGTRTAFAYAYCAGVAGGSASCPAHGAYVTTATPQDAGGAQNGPWVKTYHDAHGRAIAADTQGFTGATVRQATEYDALGRTWRESRPYFLSGGTPKWTTYAYDAIGRALSVTLPDNSVSTFAYNGLTTSVTNDKNQTETTVKNARGEIVAVTDANGKTTSFTYDPFGNRTSITDPAGNVQTMTYDKAGRKIAGVDPDLGAWSYSYNVLGELVSQTDAKGQTATMTYDTLGRPLTRVEPGLTSTWVYDNTAGGQKGIGKLHTASTSAGYLRTHSYDSLGRPSSTAIRSATGEPTHTVSTVYDSHGRVERIAYPSGFTAQYLYTSLGYQNQMKEYGGATLWTANAVDAELRITQETAGNGVVTTRTFDADRGFVTAIEAGPSGALASFSYGFDTLGNLTTRIDATQSLAEHFTYDILNRLVSYQIAGGATKTMTYDDLGNITSKSDVGAYAYAGAGNHRPHAVKVAGSNAYAYDANGNMTAGAGRTLAWTSFNKVAAIAQGATSVSWTYGPEHQRTSQTAPAGTTYYYHAAGVMFEKLVGSTVTQWADYLFAGGDMVGVKFSRSDQTELTRYFVKDHLGSVAVLTDEQGQVAERLSYDPWGKRRYPSGADDPTGSIAASTTRGFTGHEMIDDVGLVNMNGRVYDPTIGRFLSADPFIHDVTNSQDLNRYSYVHNNPLSYVDHNGYGFFKKLGRFFKKIIKPLIAIAVAIAIIHFGPLAFPGLEAGASIGAGGAAAGNLTFLQGAVIAGVSGGVSNVILTGKPKAFLAGFGQGFLTAGVGHGKFFAGGKTIGQALGPAGKAIAHGVVGGAFAEIRGGSFKSGFLAAGFSSAAAPLGPQGSLWKGAAFHAAVGGVGSVLGGGKFADGAVTGAFAYLFNDVLDEAQRARRIAIRDANRAIARIRELQGALEAVGYDPRALRNEADITDIRNGGFWDPDTDPSGNYVWLTLENAAALVAEARDALKGATLIRGPCDGDPSTAACVRPDARGTIEITDYFGTWQSPQRTLIHEGAHAAGHSGDSPGSIAYKVECYVYCIIGE